MIRCNIIRIMDIVLCSLALIVLAPIFITLMLVLKFTGEGEIFYIQKRVGYKGSELRVLKFATMVKNSAEIGTGTITLKNDPRVLPVGKFLRKTKLNELPQLINVLRGDMSLIGPRPQTERCFAAFPSEHHDVIQSVPPGVSGIGSIFFRNEEELMDKQDSDTFYDFVIMPYKGELECWYVKNRNIITYFKLIFLTIQAVISNSPVVLDRYLQNIPNPPKELTTKDL